MTNALKNKIMANISYHEQNHGNMYIQGCENNCQNIHHYGENYRIYETDSEYKIFRCCQTDIHDTLIGTIAKN